jgi:hypothetical protein
VNPLLREALLPSAEPRSPLVGTCWAFLFDGEKTIDAQDRVRFQVRDENFAPLPGWTLVALTG